MTSPGYHYVMLMTNLDPPYGSTPSEWQVGTVYHSHKNDRIIAVDFWSHHRDPQLAADAAYRSYNDQNGATQSSLLTIIACWRVEQVIVDGAAITAALRKALDDGHRTRVEEADRKRLRELLAKYPDEAVKP